MCVTITIDTLSLSLALATLTHTRHSLSLCLPLPCLQERITPRLLSLGRRRASCHRLRVAELVGSCGQRLVCHARGQVVGVALGNLDWGLGLRAQGAGFRVSPVHHDVSATPVVR
jgi:hypothetical protein